MSARAALLSVLASAGLVAAGFGVGALGTVASIPHTYGAAAAPLPGTIAGMTAEPTRTVSRSQLRGAQAGAVQLVSSPAYTPAGYRDSMQAQLDLAHV